jgi:hypothetical protein
MSNNNQGCQMVYFQTKKPLVFGILTLQILIDGVITLNAADRAFKIC